MRLPVLLLITPLLLAADNPPTLTVDFIMRDPKWMGSFPSQHYWAEDGSAVYFLWNPEKADADSLYQISRNGETPKKVPPAVRQNLPARSGAYTRDFSKKVFERDGDIFLLDVKSAAIRQVTNTSEQESAPVFSFSEKEVLFIKERNLYSWEIATGGLAQHTDFLEAEKPKEAEPKTDEQKYLSQEELRLIATLKKRKDDSDKTKRQRKALEPKRPKKIYIGKKEVEQIKLSPDEKFVTFRLSEPSKDARTAQVPSYITESGFTEEIATRLKVGEPARTFEFGVYDVAGDTVFYVTPDSLPEVFETPEFTTVPAKKDSAQSDSSKAEKPSKKKSREVNWHGPFWSDDGKAAFVIVLSMDNKDRWITLLDLKTRQLKTLDHQHDNAWIGGPSVGWFAGSGAVGWMPDDRRVWFCSEASGYSNLYAVNVATGEKQMLAGGKFEIDDPFISRDKKRWYFTSNETHPGEWHFYSMPINGGPRTKLTSMVGRNEVELSPDEKKLAIRHSSFNQPWEIYLQENRAGAEAKRVTLSPSEEFKSYPWRVPELITYNARDGAKVYARLYKPEKPNGAAVLFVHGAGYLQNAHKWWSYYFREYMFHNLLADRGYTVLDADYRASAGYGRDWRTAIYRQMGGKDLDDIVDGAKFLVEQHGIDAKRIGVYGGSYGGFITLMAMFTTPDVFAAGAALRPVTDWAHYNHGYTSNILNIPQADTLAYRRSSPIYFAEGLKGALLICHGMVDVNVHFQDTVRLTQRLIELGKENWETAIYPMEDHGFKEPSSWSDEYKRILKLFEENLRER
jgi:dipeptidyl aminopeptidase/acylaminoacyl peptidase